VEVTNLSWISSPLKRRPIGCPETSLRNYATIRCVISQKIADLTYFTAEAQNHAEYPVQLFCWHKSLVPHLVGGLVLHVFPARAWETVLSLLLTRQLRWLYRQYGGWKSTYLPQDTERLPLLHVMSALFFTKMKTNAVQSLTVPWLFTCQPTLHVHRQGTGCKKKSVSVRV